MMISWWEEMLSIQKEDSLCRRDRLIEEPNKIEREGELIIVIF
jgi:hypothetical protein